MVSLMGPPPKAFLERSENCRKYWDSDGTVSSHLFMRPELTQGKATGSPQLQSLINHLRCVRSVSIAKIKSYSFNCFGRFCAGFQKRDRLLKTFSKTDLFIKTGFRVALMLLNKTNGMFLLSGPRKNLHEISRGHRYVEQNENYKTSAYNLGRNARL